MSTHTNLTREIIDAFDQLNGRHPGFRPAHAKGILLCGEFKPSPEAAQLTRAPHAQRASTPVWVRFSDFAGVPAIPDNSPDASPRGIAIRFRLAEHVHTDITAHSVDGFPARTADEFLDFLRAAANAGSMPEFLATHPAAREFVATAKPMPFSFATESFFGVNAYRFTNHGGVSRYIRYRIRPAEQPSHLTPQEAAATPPDYLFDEIKARIERGPVHLNIFVQIADDGDTVDDSTLHWPETRVQTLFGTVRLTGTVPSNAEEQRHIIFDPIPRVDGIDPSGDPLLEPRAAVYLMSGRRRRNDAVDGIAHAGAL